MTTPTEPTIEPEPDEATATTHGRPGQRVEIGDGIEGLVTSIQLRLNADDALYVSAIEVSWWDGCSRRCEWLEPWEVSAGIEPVKIGF